MLAKRIVSGLLFLPVFYLIVWKLAPLYLAVLVVIAAAVGQYEFYRMAQNKGARPLSILGMALGSAIIIGGFYYRIPSDGGLLLYGAASMLLITGVRLFSVRSVDGALEDVAATLLGIFYVALLFGFQVGVRLGGDGKQWIVFMYFVIWATDIGAYAVGMSFGKRRLYPKISPKKSVEGLAGGLLFAAVMALLCRVWFMPPVSIAEAAGVGLLLASAGTIGDLVESMLKRSAGVKDSGTIIPGHGGMLDRMDSMLFAAPVLFYYLMFR